MTEHAITSKPVAPIQPDDPKRSLAIARPNTDHSLPHIGLVGDTYTILLSGDDTDGRYCLIGMDITLGGGPPPIGMISRSPSPSSKARSKPLSAAKSRSCAPARPSTSQPTHRTPSPTLSSKRCGCCASACRPGRKSSSCRSVSLWRPT